jgi:ribose 5-phosphate isomerase B
MKLAIGSDHAGYELKEFLKLSFSDIEWLDKGCHSSESVDYPDYAHAVATSIERGESSMGILICGSGNGISIAANKHTGIRAAIAWKPELASLARQHNDANILSLPARFISKEEAIDILRAFLDAEFEGGRHQKRVDKISC